MASAFGNPDTSHLHSAPGRREVLFALTVAALTFSLFMGCVRPQSEASLLTADESLLSDSIVEACVHRLLEEQPPQPLASMADQIGDESDTESYRIPMAGDLASDGCRYRLLIDPSKQVAWITVTGGIAGHIWEAAGPWSVSHTDVQQLIGLLSTKQQSSKNDEVTAECHSGR